MDDHQVNAIIATAICECSRDPSEYKIDPEQAKQMAKMHYYSTERCGA